MPHFTLEYSSNIIEKQEFNGLFEQVHMLLAEQLPADIKSCKSRAYEARDYYVGTDAPNSGFIHARLQIMPGRAHPLLMQVGESLKALIEKHFAQSAQQLQLAITLEISELGPCYLK